MKSSTLIAAASAIVVFSLSAAATADQWVDGSTTIERSAMSRDRACAQVDAAVAEYDRGEKRLVSRTPCECRQLQEAWYSCSSFVRYKIRQLTND